jgi:hypothetical protein
MVPVRIPMVRNTVPAAGTYGTAITGSAPAIEFAGPVVALARSLTGAIPRALKSASVPAGPERREWREQGSVLGRIDLDQR